MLFYFIIFLAMPHGMWDLKFPNQKVNLCPLQWKHGVLTTRLPGKSPFHVILAVEILVKQLAQWTWLHMLTKVFLINFLIIEASPSSQELFTATMIRTLESVNTNNSLTP